MSHKNKLTLIIGAFFLLPILFFWYYILDVCSFGADGAYLWYPHLSFIVNSWRAHQFPLWNPFDFCGRPCVGDTFAGVFYPLFWPLVLFVKNNTLPYQAMEFASIFHVFLTGSFTFLFARALNLSLFSSFVSGIIYMFCGNTFAFFDSPPAVQVTWFPFVLFSFQKALDRRDYKYAMLGSMGIGLSGLFMHPQYYIYMMYAVGFYFTYDLWQKKKDGFNNKELFFVLRVFLVLMIIGFALAAVQIIPAVELALNSTRAKIDWSQSVYNSLHPKKLLTFFIPYFYVEPPRARPIDAGFEEYYMYLGILPLVLSIIGMFFSTHAKRKFFIILFIVCLLYALGKYEPVQPLFYLFLPGFDKIRAPTRINWIYDFSLAMLAGMGMDVLLQTLKPLLKDKIVSFYKKILKVGIVVLSVVVLLSIFWFAWIIDIDFEKVKELASTRMLKTTYVFLIFFFCSLGILKLCLRNRIKPRTLKILVILLILLDLFYNQTKINSYDTGIRRRVHGKDRFPPVARIDFMKNDPDIFRALTEVGMDFERRDQILLHNWGSVYGIHNAAGYAPMTIKRIADLLQLENARNLLLLLNIKYMISKYDSIDVARIVFKDREYNVFQLNDTLPRAFFVKNFKTIENDNDILNYISSPNFNPKEEVILEEYPNIKLVSSNTSPEKLPIVKIVKYLNNEIRIDADVSSDGFLVLSDIYYPGWRAYVDSAKVKIFRANYGFRAVYLDKGKHTVSMMYRPVTFYSGLLITLLSFILIVLYFIFQFIKKNKYYRKKVY